MIMAENKNEKECNVPHLRFPEFTEEWKKCIIGELSIKVGSGVTPRGGESVYKTEGHPFVRSQNVGFGHLLLDDIAFIDEEMHLRQKNTELKLDDVLLNITGASIGRSALVNEQIAGGNVNQHVCIIRTKENLVSSFLCNFLLSNYGQRQIDSFQAGGNRQGLNFEQIKSIKIAIPSTKEQRKIATLLHLIDERITTQNKIIEDLKKLKSAISKHLFSQEPNVWNRLDNLFVKGKAGGTPISTNKEYYNGNIPFLSINDITRQGKYIWLTEKHISLNGLENSSAWIVPKHSLIMSMYASVGLVTINQVPIATSQAMFSMLLRDKSLLDYLYYYLSYFKYRHIHKYLETGTQSNINADIVSGIMIPDYGYRHNMQIASMLQSIDMKIDNESSILERYSQQKNDLLSSLFI